MKIRVPEKVVQPDIVQLIRLLGGKEYVLGTHRPRGKACPRCGFFVTEYQGTCQTRGIADLFAFLPQMRRTRRQDAPETTIVTPWQLVAIECKATDGQLRPEQQEFREYCRAANVAHVTGDLDAVIAWLENEGYVCR